MLDCIFLSFIFVNLIEIKDSRTKGLFRRCSGRHAAQAVPRPRREREHAALRRAQLRTRRGACRACVRAWRREGVAGGADGGWRASWRSPGSATPGPTPDGSTTSPVLKIEGNNELTNK